jgi:anti-sigma factor RsiW
MSFSCTDKDTLIAYVYGECDDARRTAVEAHLATCAACADEVGGFGRVRTTLSEWTPPDRVGSFRLVREEEVAAQAPARILRPARWWQAPVPALARVAAGVLLFAGGAALANLEVRYDNGGFSVRTGWQKGSPAGVREAVDQLAAPVAQATPATTVASAPAGPPAQQPSGADAPWRTEMASLERQLRDEFHQQLTTVRAASAVARPVGVPAAVSADERRFMGAVQAMIDDSAERQQLWTSYRINQVMGDIQVQRRADLARVQQNFDRLDAVPAAITAPRDRTYPNNLFPVTLKK